MYNIPVNPSIIPAQKSYKVGDIVNFHGGTHYYSSYPGAKGYSARAGKAKITIANGSGKAHPWHLIHTCLLYTSAPEIKIKPGSKIIVEQNGTTTEYSASGEPAVYFSHSEYRLARLADVLCEQGKG